MPTGSVSRLLALALAAGSLVACSTGSTPAEVPTDAATARGAADVVHDIEVALRRRAAAVLDDDPTAYARGLGKAKPFAAEQQTYFANLTQLPLARFDYEVDPASLVRKGRSYWVVVGLRTQLDGFDEHPVTSPDRYRFRPKRRGSQRMVLVSTTDAAWERRNRVPAQPWDNGPIEVRTASGVLGIFDAESVTYADAIVDSVRNGIADVSVFVPYPWTRSVVVYALSDDDFLRSIDDLPTGDPGTLDGVAFPVPVKPGSRRLASTRFVLNSTMLARGGRERDRLVRHELTHVAIASHDDGAPVWLSEGLAEYVSVRPLAPQDRAISPAAITAARRGLDELPGDDTFNDPDAREHYAVSWWACEYIASFYGSPALWSLLDAMTEKGADPDAVLQQQLGLSPKMLAKQAGRLIIATYDPDSLLRAEPTTK